MLQSKDTSKHIEIRMDPINQVPYIEGGIPLIKINGIPVHLNQIREVGTRNVRDINVADMRIWMQSPPQSIPVVVPVTTFIGTPIVNVPGCVTVSKENTTKPEGNKNKQLPKDDPKGSMTLCDGGAPYFNPPDYDYDNEYEYVMTLMTMIITMIMT